MNQRGMQLFKLGERETPLAMLQKAEKGVENLKQYWYFNQKDLGDLLTNLNACKAITTTYNNLGVFYKQLGKTNQAIKYLKLVLDLEQEMNCLDNKDEEISSTFVNICSIYSEMGKHDIALTYIKRAVELLDEAYEHKLHSILDLKEKRQFVQIVATAFHNAGVEYEFLENFDKCLQSYQKAFGITLQHLGSDHPLTQAFEKSLIGAKRKIDNLPESKKKGNKDRSKENNVRIKSQSQTKKLRLKSLPPKVPNTQRANQRVQIKQQQNELRSISPLELGNRQFNNNTQMNEYRSYSHIQNPLPYLNRISNNSQLDRSKLKIKINNNSVGVSTSNKRIDESDRQEYYSIRDLLEQSRNEIQQDISSLSYNPPSNLQKNYNIYSTIDHQRPQAKSPALAQSNNTLNLMLLNNPSINKSKSRQTKYSKTGNDVVVTKPVVQKIQNADISTILSKEEIEVIRTKEDTRKKRQEQIVTINKKMMKEKLTVEKKQSEKLNSEQGGSFRELQSRQRYKEDTSDIGSLIGDFRHQEERKETPITPINLHKDQSQYEDHYQQTNKPEEDLDSLISNLKRNLGINSKYHQNQADQQQYYQEEEATVKLTVQKRVAAFRYVALYNRYQKKEAIRLLHVAIKQRAQKKSAQEKRNIVKNQDTILQIINSRQNSPYKSPNGALRQSYDTQPIVLDNTNEELEQISMINNRAKRQKVFESLKSKSQYVRKVDVTKVSNNYYNNHTLAGNANSNPYSNFRSNTGPQMNPQYIDRPASQSTRSFIKANVQEISNIMGNLQKEQNIIEDSTIIRFNPDVKQITTKYNSKSRIKTNNTQQYQEINENDIY